MYKTIIIEDEYRLREALAILLEMVAPENVQVVGYAENIGDARNLIERLKPDLVFMDIMLTDGTAFDVLEQISYRNFQLIFTTAYEQHAVKAFKYSALDYLLKPIDLQELEAAIARLPLRDGNEMVETQINELQRNLQKTPDRLVLPTQEAMYVIQLAQIIRCETSGSYTTFHVADGRKIMVSKPLKSYEDILLLPDFYRIHQSHLININYIESYSREGMIKMKDQTAVPVARAKKEQFFSFMKDGFM